MGNETERLDMLPATDRDLASGLSKSISARTERWRTMPEKGEVRGNSGWRLVPILTCNSFVILGYWGERLIEQFISWFPSKFPSGQLELNSLIK